MTALSVRSVAANVRAAWRSGGFHYHLCGLLPFNFVLPFLRGYCRRCAKPPVGCWCFCRDAVSLSVLNASDLVFNEFVQEPHL